MSANTVPGATNVDVDNADGDAMPSANVVGGNSDVVGTWHGVAAVVDVMDVVVAVLASSPPAQRPQA